MSAPELVVKRTRLRAGAETAYEKFHREVPAEVDAALRYAGVRSWRIFRSGGDLIHIIETESREVMRDRLAGVASIEQWNASAREFLEPLDAVDAADWREVWALG